MASRYVVQDLDVKAAFEDTLNQIASIQSKNFATYFDHEAASTAINLDSDSLVEWMRDHSKKLGIKWIHFWADASQRPQIEALASHYDISPRLVGLLCSQANVSMSQRHSHSALVADQNRSLHSTGDKTRYDVESSLIESGTNSLPLNGMRSELKGITFSDIIEDLWHFHSVDYGERYIHIGVNILAVVPGVEYPVSKPAGQRLWSSLILCHDGTVISTLQRHPTPDTPDLVRLTNKVSKRHILDVLGQITRATSRSSREHNDVLGIKIRPNARAAPVPTNVAQKERMEYASLLFYYLFDDWMSTYALIARREHPYREKLEKVRLDLITAPDVQVLETLHNIGRQLTVLKSIYQGYAAVVTQILTRNYGTPVSIPHGLREATDNSSTSFYGPEVGSRTFHSSPPTSQFIHSADSTVSATDNNHPTISSAALLRFERLLDRIHLYALSEINQALSEKESLSLMTFNLLTLSESHSIEKLTRTTILLAKATILFLPVSLLTSYFSINVKGITNGYTLQTYWLSFLVVVVASILFLAGFEFAMETIQGSSGFLSLHKALWRKGTAKWVMRKQARY